jgi:hypothetical protein
MTSALGECPTCRAYRNAKIHSEHTAVWRPYEPFGTELRGEANRILECVGCNTIYFQRKNLEFDDKHNMGDDESLNPVDNFAELEALIDEARDEDPESKYCRWYEGSIFWPSSSKRERPDWLPKLSDKILIKLLNSVYTALEHDLNVLAAIGMRVVFDRASELLGVDPIKSFPEKLDQLHKDGNIGAVDQKTLEALTEGGNAAAHRGYEPDLQELDNLASIMEHFVNNHFVLKDVAATLKESIPPRKKKRASNDGERTANLIEFPPPKPSKNSSL